MERDVAGVVVVGVILGLVGAALTAPAEDVLIIAVIGVLVVYACRSGK